MMKSKLFFAITALLLSALPAFALIPGDFSRDYPHRLEWVNCSPMPLGRLDAEKHRNIPELRGVVFFYTRAESGSTIVALLENARRSFNGKLLIALITPDDIVDTRDFAKRYPESRLRLAVDMERKLTPEFMRGGSMILPAAFLLDKAGKILWRGEAMDLPEAAEQALQGKLDIKLQQKTAPLIEKMQQALGTGNMLLILRLADQVFALDPGNPAALRMALFAAESTRNPNLAWNLTMRQYQQAKHLPRLSFTALELILRNRALRDKLPGLIADFTRNISSPRVRYAFADALLRNFPYDSTAVLGARDILAATPLALNAAPAEMALVLSLRARLYYALGDLDTALENQREAVQFYTRSGDDPGKAEAEKFLKFFQDIKQASPVKK